MCHKMTRHLPHGLFAIAHKDKGRHAMFVSALTERAF